MLFLFFKTQLKEIKPYGVYCYMYIIMMHILQLTSWESSIVVKKKTPKKPTTCTCIYMYVQKEYNYHYYIVGINCDGNLYSPVIVRIKKVYNKEGWIVAN